MKSDIEKLFDIPIHVIPDLHPKQREFLAMLVAPASGGGHQVVVMTQRKSGRLHLHKMMVKAYIAAGYKVMVAEPAQERKTLRGDGPVHVVVDEWPKDGLE